VYDTGGHSLKTSGGMEAMKCDMAGAATVLGIFQAVAELRLPLHIIGLVPATDNRISAAAISPGDILTVSDGTTVEVLNTDAEGRLILADALVFAKRYQPELVFDFATLTGAAARAIGKEGFVYMGTASDAIKAELQKAQEVTYERGVEFPLWDEYADQIKSDVADIKNIGGAEAGAITAGKFLQHFTDYPWVQFDIAGTSFYEGAAVGYIPKGGTGIGVRMVVEFLKNRVSEPS
jgi:leucyl aminopeptidase